MKNLPEIRIFTRADPVSRTLGIKNASLIIREITSHMASIINADKIGFKYLIKGRVDLFLIVEFIIGELSTYELCADCIIKIGENGLHFSTVNIAYSGAEVG